MESLVLPTIYLLIKFSRNLGFQNYQVSAGPSVLRISSCKETQEIMITDACITVCVLFFCDNGIFWKEYI